MKGLNPRHSPWPSGPVAAPAVLAALLGLATASIAKGPPPPPPPPDPSIVFVSLQGEIQVMNPDGSNVFTVYEGGGFDAPAWSPDATQIVFPGIVEDPPGVLNKGVYVINIDGTGLHRITPLISAAGKAPWSPVPCPDGDYWVAFRDRASAENIPGDIYLVRPDGTGRFPLTSTPNDEDAEPAWSPDALHLAIIRYDSYTPPYNKALWILDLGLDAGANLTIVNETCITCDPTHPLYSYDKSWVDWAKTGNRVVLSASAMNVGGNPQWDLWILDLADPMNPVLVTNTPTVREQHPTWSLDDSEIAFLSRGPKNSDYSIKAIRPDGTGLRTIMKGGNKPDWRRAR